MPRLLVRWLIVIVGHAWDVLGALSRGYVVLFRFHVGVDVYVSDLGLLGRLDDNRPWWTWDTGLAGCHDVSHIDGVLYLLGL